MESLNRLWLTAQEQRESIGILEKQKSSYQLAVQNRDSSITLLKSAITLQAQRITSAQDMLKQTNDLLARYSRKTKWLKVERAVMGVLIVAEAITILFISK